MTAPISKIVEAPRKRASRKRTLATTWGMLALTLCPAVAAANTISWPCDRWRNDPVGYAHDVLGVTTWDRQDELLCAVRDYPRVAVRSGHKVSKSNSAAIIAWWFVSSFPDARVVMSSVTSRQVDAILWREFRKIGARPTYKLFESDQMHELARSGLKYPDFREVLGFTAREAEAVAGVSGANLLYLLDEASGIPQAIFEAIEGNRAGGARVVMFSNPTQTEGEFFEAFHGKKDFYHQVHISSEETPNVREGRIVIPGLATREWVEEKKLEWGVDSPLYKVRVQGEFVLNEEGRIVSLHALQLAETRWHELPDEGRLHIGIDPAGPGHGGDESCFAIRRGPKVLRLYAMRGLTDSAHLAHLLGIIKEHRLDRDPPPIIKVDREGPIGNAVYGLLRAHLENHADAFELVAVRSSDRAHRQQHIYDRVRDELWANLADWLRDGGAIPEDTKLAQELHAPQWIGQVTGRLKVTPKDELRKALGRSTDRADAVALSIWEPLSMGAVAEVSRPAPQREEFTPRPSLDPYAGVTAWERRR